MANIIRFGNVAPKKLNLTATRLDVLSGKTFSVDGKTVLTGMMPNNGSFQKKVYAEGVAYIPQGYHDGTGTVTGLPLSSQIFGTASPEDILEGKSAYVDGVSIKGTMPDYSWADDITIPVNTDYDIPEGYYNGHTSVRCDVPIKSYSIYTPGTEKIVIEAGVYLTGNQVIWGDLYLRPEYIKKGITIFGVTGTYTGD